MDNFYTANKWLIVMVYLGLSVVAVGTFMGVPVGTFSLGVAAGAYVGRREYHSRTDGARATTVFRRVAFFSASVTAAAALPIGILALQSEQQILRSLEATFGLGQNRLQGSGGVVLIGFLCLILWVAQYWSTRTAGRLAFRIGARRHHHQ